MRWWGWGEDEHASPLSARAQALLRARAGRRAGSRPPSAGGPETVDAARAVAASAARARALERAVGAEHVLDDHATRVSHAAGRSYPDLVRLRAGAPGPGSRRRGQAGPPAEVAAVLAACAQAGVAVVPFGGGTSVVGGVEALRGAHSAAISLDLRRMDKHAGPGPRSR